MGPPRVPELVSLPAASTLLTSAWEVDHVLTPHPGSLYRGAVRHVVSERSVAHALRLLGDRVGALEQASLRPGTDLWQVRCGSVDGPLHVGIPCAIDEVDESGRSRLELPTQLTEHARTFVEKGLGRYLLEPVHGLRLEGNLPVVAWRIEKELRPLWFWAGRFESTNHEPATGTAELLTEIVAALVYHYQPDAAGGSTIADVSINEGDFWVRRQEGGGFELRLLLVRRIQTGISPEVLLLLLVQLYAYETHRLGADDLGLPVLIGNPSVAFAGLVRGWERRASDLGRDVAAARGEARGWIERFARSAMGRSYRPWAERFLRGELPARFGDDVREGHIDLGPLRQRQHVLELGARVLDRAEDGAHAREYQAFIEARSRELAARAALSATLTPLTNPEHFGDVLIAEAQQTAAVAAFPSFEEYMDLCLHDSTWGYYSRRVEIGRRGHFDTHPESLSPDYGTWVAERALAAWQDLVRGGELGEKDPFVLVELGAGNGRLARDIVDAVRRQCEGDGVDGAVREAWRAFRSQLEVRIYELSPSLAEKQRALLGDDAIVALGDARQPEECLRRDFPAGLRGMVVTNEVPDAFGVHKVLLRPNAPALAALVLPRLETELCKSLPGLLAQRISETDARLRGDFDLPEHSGERFLDRDGFCKLMEHLVDLPVERREAVLGGLRFEEAYVDAVTIPALAEHLAARSEDDQRALAKAGAALLRYVNVHAAAFLRGIGGALAAGFVLTIDYGGSSTELAQTIVEGRRCFRTYGLQPAPHCPRPNDPYAFPGAQDLTADVDFTDLARAGRAAGLELIHYGPESDLAGPALREVLTVGAQRYAPLLDEAGFKVLVLGTRKSEWFGSEGVVGGGARVTSSGEERKSRLVAVAPAVMLFDSLRHLARCFERDGLYLRGLREFDWKDVTDMRFTRDAVIFRFEVHGQRTRERTLPLSQFADRAEALKQLYELIRSRKAATEPAGVQTP